MLASDNSLLLFSDLEKGAKQRFARQLSINHLVQCIAPCPYYFIDKFL
jgi:hypothetical protein